jgi:uncharacterized protein YjdB
MIAATLLFAVASCGDDEETPGYTPEVIDNPVTGITIANATADGIVLPDAGATATVQVSATPANAGDADRYSYTYASGDRRVFTVSDAGMVTATGVGEAWLTVVPKNNAALTAKCKVTVVGVRVTAIEVAEACQPLTLTRTNVAGPTFELSAHLTFVPDNVSIKRLDYTSSNPGVVTVNEDGMVTAIEAGTATIRVAAVDGSGVTAGVQVTVVNTPVTEITLGANVGTMALNTFRNVVGTNEAVEATFAKGTAGADNITVVPAEATNSVFTYASSDEQVITVTTNADNALVVTPHHPGTATITISATDDSGVSTTANVTVYDVLDRTGWTIADSSPGGSFTSGSDVFGGPIDNVIQESGSGALVKADAQNNSPQGIADSYFTVDLGAETNFGYVIFSDTWNGDINSQVKVNRFSLYGSHNGTEFSLIQGTVTKSVSTYNVPIKLDASHTYKYVKVVVWNNSNSNSYKRVPRYVIENFRLAQAPQ